MPKKIFIGKSPLNKMTEYSGGHGPDFDGNSILLELKTYEGYLYLFIGLEVYDFKPLGKIVEYVSPVGNNDFPYPYAIDEFGNYYLMLEKKMLDKKHQKKILKNDGDPYTYMYNDETVVGTPLQIPRLYIERL